MTASPVANVDSALSTTKLTRLDPHPLATARLDDRVAHRERRADGAKRIVLAWGLERGEDSVAGELLDEPSVLCDTARDGLEELVHAPTRDLRIGAGHEARRVDEVYEQHRCELSLHPVIVETSPGVPGIPARPSR